MVELGLGLKVQHEDPGLFPVREDRAEQREDVRWMEDENFWQSFCPRHKTWLGCQ